MMWGVGSFQIRGTGLPDGNEARDRRDGMRFEDGARDRFAGETPPGQPAGCGRYFQDAGYLRAFVLCCGKLRVSRTNRAD
jgi:hypothetical protein